ncbi:hypothetical protein Tco_1099148, partial [Tanacetum coccineum]
GKEVDIGLDGGCDKPLRLADMLPYSWDESLDVCVDLTGSSPLTQSEMADFVSGGAVIDDANINVLKEDAVTLLKRRKFFMAQDIGARVVVHIFNRIGFAIAKGSWISAGLEVCVDLTGSSPLTQTGMADFVPGRTVIDVVQRKRVKYMAKYAAIEYGFLPFFFSSFGELEEDAVTLLKRIRKFSMVQDIRAHVTIHIFNRISFAIVK